ncbi:MAG TPA: ATP-grasp domain-containing protein [Terriglobales bacterium]|nr:ATP-grasp domain-containing protein [Terriglobales bacterium]
MDSLRAAIEAVDPHLVIPCDDLAVRHLHELHARAGSLGASGLELSGLIERSLGSPRSYPVVSARFDLLRVAEQQGLRVPATDRVATLADLEGWLQRQAFPCVLKADGTWGGCGVRIARSAEQARQFFLELTPTTGIDGWKGLILNRDRFWRWPWRRHAKPSVIAQSYVAGRPANCAVVSWQGRILAGVGVDVVSADGVKGPANVVRVVDNPDMMLAAEKIASRLGLSGFFGLDFMIEEDSGATYLVEMNPRCTPLCHLNLGEGRDLVGALVAQLSGQPCQMSPPVTVNDMIAYFPGAWNCQSKFLTSSYQDIPQGEPELIEALLHPWPERSLLGRAVDCVRQQMRLGTKPNPCVFSAAVERAKSSELCQKL